MQTIATKAAFLGWTLLITGSIVNAEEDGGEEPESVTLSESLSDDWEGEIAGRFKSRNWFIVPIPVSNPTLDTGVVLAGAYFYRQTDEQKEVQSPSFTGAGAFKSSNDSAAFAVAHQGYWSEDRWRFFGGAGYLDLNFDLPVAAGTISVTWQLEGEAYGGILSRRIRGEWYAGVIARYLDMRQTFSTDISSDIFLTTPEISSAGAGVKLERDSRDKPGNSHSGTLFEATAVFNRDASGGDTSYEAYAANFSSYHLLLPSVVLAWELRGCARSGQVPLWDTCRIGLRGFNSMDYLGTKSGSGQLEARWQFHRLWGVVAFAGGGYYEQSFNMLRENEIIPSYGIGLRFLVLESQRINMRLDYARSTDSDAIYLTVGEAF